LLVNEAIVESGWANLFLRFKGRWLEKAKKPFAQEKGALNFSSRSLIASPSSKDRCNGVVVKDCKYVLGNYEARLRKACQVRLAR
jgi:hypothetical protein